jgi:hypothetical protein
MVQTVSNILEVMELLDLPLDGERGEFHRQTILM